MWIINKDRTLAMSCLPKVGSHSIRTAFDMISESNNSDVLDISKRIAWIRHPLERLISNYSFFKRERHGAIRLGGAQGMPFVNWLYEEFVDFVLANKRSLHFGPQVSTLTLRGNFVPTICHRFEDIDEYWSQYTWNILQRLNPCKHEKISSYRRGDILHHYAEDFNLWYSLNNLEKTG